MELTAYFDESGHDDKLLVMGGFVSTTEKWIRFSAECDLIKAHFGISHVHAAELFNLKRTRRYGQLSLERRYQLAGAVMSAIVDHTELSVTAVVIPRVYNSLTTDKWRSRHGTAYASCVSGILVGFVEHFDLPPGETLTLNIFLEDGHSHAAEAEQVILDYKTFSDKSEIPIIGKIGEPPLRIGAYGRLTKEMAPLWAADLISYCTYNQIARQDSFCADIMQKLHDRVPGFGVKLFREQIRTIIDSTVQAETAHREWAEDMHHLVKYLFQFGVSAHRDQRGIILDFSGMTSEQKRQFFEQ